MTDHVLVPETYRMVFGGLDPELTVSSGDRVTTDTVDAEGRDATGALLGELDNAQNGPIHVRGATPGDTLAVTIEEIVPLGGRGWSWGPLVPGVIARERVADLGLRAEPERGFAWDVDLVAGVVRLVGGSSRLAGLTLPLEPMIGCFGVAPDCGEVLSIGALGPHGGNMDYPGFRPGATMLFPVFVPGALFSLGDVHARQGDGEIVGSGVEVPARVTFTLDVIHGRTIGWPRVIDPERGRITVGSDAPLDRALQHATTEMLDWLMSDGLSLADASQLLGLAVRYRIGNVGYSPISTVACELPRAVLEQVGLPTGLA